MLVDSQTLVDTQMLVAPERFGVNSIIFVHEHDEKCLKWQISTFLSFSES